MFDVVLRSYCAGVFCTLFIFLCILCSVHLENKCADHFMPGYYLFIYRPLHSMKCKFQNADKIISLYWKKLIQMNTHCALFLQSFFLNFFMDLFVFSIASWEAVLLAGLLSAFWKSLYNLDAVTCFDLTAPVWDEEQHGVRTVNAQHPHLHPQTDSTVSPRCTSDRYSGAQCQGHPEMKIKNDLLSPVECIFPCSVV